MQLTIQLQLKPNEAFDNMLLQQHISNTITQPIDNITGFYIVKQSIDARSRQQVWIILTIKVFINEPFVTRKFDVITFPFLKKFAKQVVVVGAGPAGIFAALKLIELGIKPIIIERGKDVRTRRRDLAILNKDGIVDTESNYCFGEGGAGTYSDGKLYTRSNKRGNIYRILNLFVQFGANEKILTEAHPHIGTNKLPHIITAMREQIIASGGEVLFEKKLVDCIIQNNELKGVKTSDGDTLMADAVILATGHSARDIFELLQQKNILIEAKPFALGVRIEHPQSIIDAAQYHLKNDTSEIPSRGKYLPPASYSLVEQVQGKGVFSFCMCPGGIIAPAATNANELVVNGWSPSKRNNPFANSGMVVTVEPNDAVKSLSKYQHLSNAEKNNPLLLMYFQKMVEANAFKAGGGKFVAPAQRVVDFCTNKLSASLPNCSYLPGIQSVELEEVLPTFIQTRLQQAIQAFGKKMKGYYTNEAIVVATESRTSSPVRIPRDATTLQHPQIKNLYPCAEGAGYAGGIVSAAMDGENVAVAIAKKIISVS